MIIHKSKLVLLYCFMLLVFSPPLSFVLLSLPSMSYGFVIAVFLSILMIGRWTVVLPRKITWFWTILSLLFLHSIVSLAVSPSLFEFISLISLLVCVFGALIFGAYLRDVSTIAIRKSILLVSNLLLFLLVISVFSRINIYNYANFSKNVFPFSEPSHFVVFSSVLLALGFLMSTPFRKGVYLVVILFCGFSLPSLSLVIVALFLLTFLITYHIKWNFLLALIAFAFLLPAAVSIMDNLHLIDISYFEERLRLNETNNISALVYWQGWTRSVVAIQQTYGFGVGFQSLETVPIDATGDLLFRILGRTKNLKDGGFVAAKLIGEFGLLGIAFVLSYASVFLRAYFFIVEYMANKPGWLSKSDLVGDERQSFLRFIGAVMIVFYAVELLVRGVGYFTPGLFFLLTGFTFFVGYANPKLCRNKNY